MVDLYYGLMSSFGLFWLGSNQMSAQLASKCIFGKISESEIWVNKLLSCRSQLTTSDIIFWTQHSRDYMKRIQCSKQMGQEWIAMKRKARVKSLNILKILGSYPSNTSFSNGAFWSHTGQIHVVFLQNIKTANQCILTRLLPVIRKKENTTQFWQ